MENKNTNLVKMTPAEAARFMWEHLTSRTAFDFIVPWNADEPNGDNNIYRCAMLIVAGHSAVIANAYGGGELFTFEVPLTGKFAYESFEKAFSKYLIELGNDIFVNPEPQRTSSETKKPLIKNAADLATYLDDNLPDLITVRFTTEQEERFTFRFTDFQAGTITAVCNSANGNRWFAYDVSNEEGVESFREAFLAYLNQHGITGMLRVEY